jgi:hypothetical protein
MRLYGVDTESDRDMPASVEGIEKGRRNQEAWRHVIKVAATTVYG